METFTDDSSILSWHVDGWFKGALTALSILSLFLAIPGFFERSFLSKLNGAMVILAVISIVLRPTRMVYSEDSCYIISVIYWTIDFIFVGLIFAYIGNRLELYTKAFCSAAVLLSSIHISTLVGYSNDCEQGMLLNEYYPSWSGYAGALLVLVSLVTIVITTNAFYKAPKIQEDKRLTRINYVSKVSLIFAAFYLFLSGLFSFTMLTNFRLLFMYSSIYALTTSHLAMLLYKSLNIDTATSMESVTQIGSNSPQPK